MLNSHTQVISRLKVQMSQLASSLSETPKGILSSQPLANPKNPSQAYEVQDPRCSTISCTIGQTEISRALLDLRASFNLLPLSLYQQLGIGELSPTRVTIQLAD